MSKKIKMSQDDIQEILNEFKASLKSLKSMSGKLKFEKDLGGEKEVARLVFTSEAWTKMQLLILKFDKEIAWHGLANRMEDIDPEYDGEPNSYLISDIIVYPQVVTGVTVTTDQKEYEEWLISQDDQVFNQIRCQGHSHVNMATSPSSVDTEGERQILEQLTDNMFYIFMIWNKSFSHNIRIYDMKKNILFENGDVSVSIEDEELEEFYNDAKDKVKNQQPKPVVTTSTTKSNKHKKSNKKSKSNQYVPHDEDDDELYFYTGKYSKGIGYYGFDWE